MEVLSPDKNFLGITEPHLFNYETSSVIIQQIPYEHTSSYKKGSDLGPASILANSHYVEFYDTETQQEAYKKVGIAVVPEMTFNGAVDDAAMQLIKGETKQHLDQSKFVVTLGAEHTITAGVFAAFQEKFPDIGILQIDAHSDLRMEYEGNAYSHACVMARIHEMNAPEIRQVGIRAQCIEEAQLIQSSENIQTWFDHTIHDNDDWMDEVVNSLPPTVYITVDTDGFDPNVCPSVGTAEPGGLKWYQCLKLLRKVFETRDVKGFDIVELNPSSDDDITAYTMAQLCYKMIGYHAE